MDETRQIAERCPGGVQVVGLHFIRLMLQDADGALLINCSINQMLGSLEAQVQLDPSLQSLTDSEVKLVRIHDKEPQ